MTRRPYKLRTRAMCSTAGTRRVRRHTLHVEPHPPLRRLDGNGRVRDPPRTSHVVDDRILSRRRVREARNKK